MGHLGQWTGRICKACCYIRSTKLSVPTNCQIRWLEDHTGCHTFQEARGCYSFLPNHRLQGVSDASTLHLRLHLYYRVLDFVSFCFVSGINRELVVWIVRLIRFDESRRKRVSKKEKKRQPRRTRRRSEEKCEVT